ncbi:ABC1 kinase family protein [Candidatus Contubernalis alkaliaceticus]|uniref:ABC1 kinase family protein n=1 Tax=Candidatus Contubernalis alkaliaceticus TaxID=338645 RepID=UPI001F4BE528|nr:lipopolysaccharide core heptose(II) kinase RfaY [Candidatus Contubernalis alkalaceticus]UNC92392.1 hypothetical protein HUE98_09940 [Candidatus Contubernalis alkalaceticus]
MRLQKRYKHFHRYREIAQTLTKHGFGYLIKQLGLKEFLKGWRTGGSEEGHQLSTAERIRLVLEELGTTFIKLGQILSTRPDLIPKEITDELSKLQDQVPPFPFSEVRKQIETELGDTLENLFKEIDPIPLAAASIGQVHRATLLDGKKMVVKVQRPDIEENIKIDLEILFDIARLVEKHTEWSQFFNFKEAVLEYEDILLNELDYLVEGQNIDVFQKNFKDQEEVCIPEVHWDYTTRRVLTMEYIEGIKLDNVQKLSEKGVDTKKIAQVLSKSVFKQMLYHGFFHGDPHPGNILVIDNNTIALLDFGIVGMIDEEMKEQFSNLLIAQVNKNTEAVMRSFLTLGITPPDINRRELKQDIERMRYKYYDRPLDKIKVGDTMKEFMELAYKYKILLPAEFTLMGKTFVILEGQITRLSPETSLMEIAEPFGRELIKERFSFGYLRKTLSKNVHEYGQILGALPKQIVDLVEIMERGQFKATLKHDYDEKILIKISHMVNRLAFSIVLASLIIGLSYLIQITEQSIIWKLPVAEIGFLIAGAMGFGLLISIIRSGRF